MIGNRDHCHLKPRLRSGCDDRVRFPFPDCRKAQAVTTERLCAFDRVLIRRNKTAPCDDCAVDKQTTDINGQSRYYEFNSIWSYTDHPGVRSWRSQFSGNRLPETGSLQRSAPWQHLSFCWSQAAAAPAELVTKVDPIESTQSTWELSSWISSTETGMNQDVGLTTPARATVQVRALSRHTRLP